MTEFYRVKSKKRKSYTRKGFMAGLNVYLLYLLLDFNFLFTTSIWLVGLSSGLFIIRQISSKRKNTEFSRNVNLKDQLRIIRKYLTINRRYIIIGGIGLILATIMISQTMLTASSYSQNSLNNFISDKTPLVEVYGNTGDDIPQIELFDEIDRIIYEKVDDTSFEINRKIFSAAMFTNIFLGGFEPSVEGIFANSTYLQIRTWKQDDLTVLNSFFNSNYNGSETVLLMNGEYDYTITPSPQNNISLILNGIYQQSAEDYYFYNTTYDEYKITSYDVQNLAYNLYDSGIISEINWYYAENTLFISEETFIELRSEAMEIIADDPLSSEMLRMDFSINYYGKLPNIVDNSIDKLQTELNVLENTLNSGLRGGISVNGQIYFLNVFIQIPLKYELANYEFETVAFRAFLILLSMPLVGVSLFLVYFSITLVEQRKSRIIAIMKIRGTSTQQVQLQQLSEIIVTGILAGLVGMILSIPWVTLTLKTSGFFEFNGTGIPLFIPNSWYVKLPQIGIILTLDLNYNSIMGLSQTNTDAIEQTEETKEPFWQRYYLDMILFVLSVGFWITIRAVPGIDPFLMQILVFGIGPYLLIGFLISAPLVASRYFGDFIGEISDILWKIRGGLFALATRNMRKNKYSSSRLVALLLMSMMLSMMAVIIPYSIQENTAEDVAYDLGADIVIHGVDISNSTQMELIGVEGVNSYTEVAKTYIYPEFGVNDRFWQYFILGINKTTFVDTAYWKDDYAKSSLSSIISKINNESAGLSEAQMDSGGLKLGDKLTGLPNSTQLTLTTTFDYFPNLVSFVPVSYDGDYYAGYGELQILTEISYITTYFVNYDSYVYVDVASNANMTKIKEDIIDSLDMDGLIVETFDEKLNSLQESDLFNLILATFQSLLIITVIISAIAVVYFSIITLSERNQEIGTLRAIGMVRSQIFVLLVVESIVLVLSGIFFGIFSGWFISSNLFFIISSETFGNVPPSEMFIPYSFILGFVILVTISSVLSAIVPARQMADKQTGNILRAE